MPSSQSPNMGLFLPVPGSTPGPQWATENTANASTVDLHDHTTGKGVKVPAAGLNINADLDFQSHAALNLTIASLIDLLSTAGLTVNGSAGNVAGQPYWRDAAGAVKKILLTGDAASGAGGAQLSGGVLGSTGGPVTVFLANAIAGSSPGTPMRFPVSAQTKQKLRATLRTNSSAVGGSITLYKNGAATAMTVAIAPGASAFTKYVDAAHPITFADGDDFDVALTINTDAGAGAFQVSVSLE